MRSILRALSAASIFLLGTVSPRVDAAAFQPDASGLVVMEAENFQGISAAAIIVMLILMLFLNALALIIRLRLSRHIQW